MKVVEYDHEVLRLEDRALLLRSFGAIFALAGISMLAFPHAWDGGSAFAAICCIVGGAALVIFPRNTSIRFDRPAGTVVLQRTGKGLSSVRREVRLDQVEKVEVEQSDTGRDATWRVRLLIRGEDPLPFTEYSTTSEDAQYRLFQRVYGWLKGMHG